RTRARLLDAALAEEIELALRGPEARLDLERATVRARRLWEAAVAHVDVALERDRERRARIPLARAARPLDRLVVLPQPEVRDGHAIGGRRVARRPLEHALRDGQGALVVPRARGRGARLEERADARRVHGLRERRIDPRLLRRRDLLRRRLVFGDGPPL